MSSPSERPGSASAAGRDAPDLDRDRELRDLPPLAGSSPPSGPALKLRWLKLKANSSTKSPRN